MKKFLIALLAALLVVSMATVAFATTATGTSGETSTSGANGPYNPSTNPQPSVACDGVNHKWAKKTISANCDTNAVEIYVCELCGHEMTQSEGAAEGLTWRNELKGTKHGHIWDENNAVVLSKGDCQTPGSVQKKCKTCGETKVFSTEGSHDWSDWSVVAKETCVEKGTYKRYCKICGKVDIKYPDPTGKHIFDTKYVKTRATCTKDGTYEAQCILCHKYFWYVDLKDDDYQATKDGTIVLKIKKRDHNLSSAVVTAATCQKDGEIEQVCLNNTSTNEYEACNYKATTVIPKETMAYNPAVKDTIQKYHNLKFVAETKDGAIGHYECTVDGCKYKSQEVVKYAGDANAVSKVSTGTAVATGTTTKPAKSTSSSTNKKGVSIPKTNDTTSNLPYVLIAVAFVGLVALVASKKKVNG